MSAPPPTPICRRFRIGYALPSKKVQTFIQPSLVEQAKQNGVDLVPVDLSKPLASHEFFHCIVHKLYGQGWNEQLKDYASKYPNSVIVDPPERIERLHSRISMLEVVSRLKIPQGRGSEIESESESLAVPKQVVVQDSEGLKSPELLLLKLGMKLPVIAKPVEAYGSATSHDMYLVINSKGLKNLTTPIVVQEFVNHGGVVFKVYVVGDHVKCVKRRSLPDIPATVSDELISSEEEEMGLLAFSQISNSAVQSEEDDGNIKEAEMPSAGFVEGVGSALRQELGLQLFNFDLIRDCTSGSGHQNSKNKYYVIDINYFPGFAKMPSFEQVLSDFFLKCCQHNTSR